MRLSVVISDGSVEATLFRDNDGNFWWLSSPS